MMPGENKAVLITRRTRLLELETVESSAWLAVNLCATSLFSVSLW